MERPRMGNSGLRGVTGATTVAPATEEGSFNELSSFEVRRAASTISGEGDNCVPPPSDRLLVLDKGDLSILPLSVMFAPPRPASFKSSTTATSL